MEIQRTSYCGKIAGCQAVGAAHPCTHLCMSGFPTIAQIKNKPHSKSLGVLSIVGMGQWLRVHQSGWLFMKIVTAGGQPHEPNGDGSVSGVFGGYDEGRNGGGGNTASRC